MKIKLDWGNSCEFSKWSAGLRFSSELWCYSSRMTWQKSECWTWASSVTLTMKRADGVLCDIRRSIVSSLREVVLTLCTALVRPHLEGHVLGWGFPSVRGQWRATKMIEELEHLTCEERLRDLGLFSLKWRLSRILLMYINTCREGAKKMEPGSFC